MGVLIQLVEDNEKMCASMVSEEGKLVLTNFREEGNTWRECLTKLVPDESKWDCPLFNPPEENEAQLVKDFIFIIRCRFDSDYSMDVVTDDPY